MVTIIFFTIIGFLCGLGYVMNKRKIRPGKILTATFLGLLATGIWKIFKDYSGNKGRFYL